jgi:hypothetical protein
MSDEQKVTALQVLPSKIVQIAADPDSDSTRYGCLALCEDGSVWGGSHKVWPKPETRWFCLSPAHVANRQQASAATEESGASRQTHLTGKTLAMMRSLDDLKFDPPPSGDEHLTTCSTDQFVKMFRKAWLWDQLWIAAERDDIKVKIEGDTEEFGFVLIAGSAQDAEELLDNLATEVKP